MIPPPPISTRTDTPFPYAALSRSDRPRASLPTALSCFRSFGGAEQRRRFHQHALPKPARSLDLFVFDRFGIDVVGKGQPGDDVEARLERFAQLGRDGEIGRAHV